MPEDRPNADIPILYCSVPMFGFAEYVWCEVENGDGGLSIAIASSHLFTARTSTPRLRTLDPHYLLLSTCFPAMILHLRLRKPQI